MPSSAALPEPVSSDVKLIAYYLPQYHPIPENDEWWGKGFTEWSNVARATPLFQGHQQPQLPSDLGFYDLRLPEVRRAQVELARANGIHGFCYYYYWFNGRRLLERPLDDMLASTDADFPFCVCWANENWTRRWDGAEREVLMAQKHSPESDERFIRDVLPILKDRRYIRVHGAPLLLVYRAGLLPTPTQTVATWRRIAKEEGVPELHLAAVRSFGLTDPRPFGFDSAVEFPPHNLNVPSGQHLVSGVKPGFSGAIFRYADVVKSASHRPRVDYPVYRGVMTAWDNSARTGLRAHIFHDSTPELYEAWLRAMVEEVRSALPEAQRFVFINAWNEWAEGAHLEPDKHWGHAYLRATRRALLGRTPWRTALDSLQKRKDLTRGQVEAHLDDLAYALHGLEQANEYLVAHKKQTDRLEREAETVAFSPVVPRVLQGKPPAAGAHVALEQWDTLTFPQQTRLTRGRPNLVRGWSFAPGVSLESAETTSFLLLRAQEGGQLYFAPFLRRQRRADVEAAFPELEPACAQNSGFAFQVEADQVPAGDYEVGVVHATADRVVYGFEEELVTLP